MALENKNNGAGVHYFADVNNNPFFVKDNKNYINIVSSKQLNSLQDVSVLDIFLSKDSIIEPHYHPNGSELTYCISGSATISMMNIDTKEFQHYRTTPGQVVNVPQGWWHYILANEDNTHFQGIFNVGVPEVVFGSDLLTRTPADVFPYAYGIDQNLWKSVISNVVPTTVIGPSSKK
ncbi:cupin domain-containing protein [Sporosarcina sp. BI001-red]|uniref:cupin domain-containing protein n=1 Tax=Sporosarcina sp. BI001-red TaxID=2282866 RepID=UPI000E27B549|nr:cupin domain-containing protein [Sporosarcina sp. BI001-red]REB05564.1 cupin domain-containing protein [Sporosarcina sp. BI001-red]